MLPLEPRLLVGSNMDESNLTCESILSDLDACDDENDQLCSPDLTEKGTGVTEAKSDAQGSVYKKRVRFLPNGCLVNVREIPARSHSSASGSEASASDSSSASDDSSYEESDSEHDNDDAQFTREHPAPIFEAISTKSTTMLPQASKLTLSRSVRKPIPKQEQVEPAVIGFELLPSTSNSIPAPVKIKQITKPRARNRRARKQNEATLSDKNTSNIVKRRKSAKNNTLYQEKQPSKRQSSANMAPNQSSAKMAHSQSAKMAHSQSAKMAHSQSSAKTINSQPSAKIVNGAERIQRRINSAKSDKRLTVNDRHDTVVSSTVTDLRTPAGANKNTQEGRVIKAMRSLSVGQLYTADENIFPSHQTVVHFPQVLQNNVKHEPTILSIPHTGDIKRLVTSDHNLKQSHQEQTNQTQPLLPFSGSNKRSYAWQMANGSISNTLQNTPSIAQLWDNERWDNERAVFSDASGTSANQSTSIARAIFNNAVKKM